MRTDSQLVRNFEQRDPVDPATIVWSGGYLDPELRAEATWFPPHPPPVEVKVVRPRNDKSRYRDRVWRYVLTMPPGEYVTARDLATAWKVGVTGPARALADLYDKGNGELERKGHFAKKGDCVYAYRRRA